jgi:hypothetical protein
MAADAADIGLDDAKRNLHERSTLEALAAVV